MFNKFTLAVIVVGILAVLTLAISGPLYRFELLTLGDAFFILRYSAITVGVVAILSLLLMIFRRPQGAKQGLLVALILVGAVGFYLPYQQYQTAMSVPRIHDISTDLENPPAFVAIAPLRADAPNPVEYAGAETAEKQREAYPDITTYFTPVSPATAFDTALLVAADMGWEIVASDPAAGLIEATATTTWFGFKDDVVIRLVATGDNTAIDVRSKSRVGLSDVGANARRIRAFIEELDSRL